MTNVLVNTRTLTTSKLESSPCESTSCTEVLIVCVRIFDAFVYYETFLYVMLCAVRCVSIVVLGTSATAAA